MEIQGEGIDLVARDVEERESSDIVKVLGGVIRLERMHDGRIHVDSKTPTDTLWQIFENLVRGAICGGDERVVEGVAEPKLDERGIGWLGNHTTWGLNNAWDAAGNTTLCWGRNCTSWCRRHYNAGSSTQGCCSVSASGLYRLRRRNTSRR